MYLPERERERERERVVLYSPLKKDEQCVFADWPILTRLGDMIII